MAAGWGGRRVGAGAKPKPRAPVSPFAVVHGGKQLEAALTLPPDADLTLCEPPAALPTDQQEFWRVHAPLAVERRTLTKATVPSFKLLCKLYVKMIMVEQLVDKGALGGLRAFMQLAKQVEALMARFCLAPFGKPAVAEKSKPAANPFAALGVK